MANYPLHPGPAAHSPPARGARPVPPDLEYHRLYTPTQPGIGRSIAALVLLVAGLLVFSTVIGFLGILLDIALGNDSSFAGGTDYTPVMHASLLLGIVVLLPWSMLVQRWLYRYPAASLHSVLSVFRWEIFGRSVAVIVPLWTLGLVAVAILEPTATIPWQTADLIALFVVTILITPLQAAAEEYGFRGLAFRVAGGWGRSPVSGLVIGTVVSSLLFATVHLAMDPWLNLYYFVFGVTLCLITWRSGGLEIAVVIHAVNNTLSFLLALVLWTDFEAGWDRSVGAGSPAILLLCVLLIGATAVVWRATRRSGPVRTPAAA